jgi:hypothetical protein
VLGSIFTSLYANHLSTTAFHELPSHTVSAAQNSVAAALTTVGHASGAVAQQRLLDGVQASFMTGFHTASLVAFGIGLAGAAGALLLPGRGHRAAAETVPAQAELVPA